MKLLLLLAFTSLELLVSVRIIKCKGVPELWGNSYQHKNTKKNQCRQKLGCVVMVYVLYS